MDDPHEILRFARWIARREAGAARLAWTGGEVIVRVVEGRVRWVEGIDTGELARRLSCRPGGSSDLLEEARSLAASGQIAENFAMGAAKELLQSRMTRWLLDPQRRLEIVEGEPDEADGATISLTHVLVELVLSDTSGRVAAAVLPDLDVLLKRSPRFLDLYAPLRLSEEADLIVSRITGERSAREITERSEHGVDEVRRLLAALVVTGILEPEPSLAVREEPVELLPTDEPAAAGRRRIPVTWILVAAAVLLLTLAVLGWLMSRDTPPPAAAAGEPTTGHHWALVIDMGCEPQDLQRVLRKAQQNPKTLKPIAVDNGGTPACWQLVWGSFSSREAAVRGLRDLPAAIREAGFDPHPIELTGDEVVPSAAPGG